VTAARPETTGATRPVQQESRKVAAYRKMYSDPEQRAALIAQAAARDADTVAGTVRRVRRLTDQAISDGSDDALERLAAALTSEAGGRFSVKTGAVIAELLPAYIASRASGKRATD
jgi:hypothetical protein